MKTKILIFTLFTNFMFSQVGINTTIPGDGAMLEVQSSTKGILIPRVALTSLTALAPVSDTSGFANGEESLLVYNNNALLTGGKGFYYWNGVDQMY